MSIPDNIFRPALLVVFLIALILTTWHIVWLHRQGKARYEIQTSEHFIILLDHEQRVIQIAPIVFDEQYPAKWRTLSLPKE